MFRSFCIVGMLILFLPLEVFPQKEASIFFLGNGNGIDFSKSPPEVLPNAPSGYSFPYATIADSEGNLLFYCNDNSVWNSTHTIIENGTDLKGVFGRTRIILQKPGSENIYYIFQVGFGPNYEEQKVIYAEVDVEANNGLGRVLSKNNVLYSNLHGSFTVSGNCHTGYWLVGEVNTNVGQTTDKILAFRINNLGVSTTPIVSQPVSIGNSGGYRFSPSGAKIFFSYSGNGPEGMAVLDFDQTTGVVSNLQNVGPCCGDGEFSDDGHFLYTLSWANSQTVLNQVDLSLPGYPSVVVATQTSISSIQLAPDGKIYFLVNDGKKMGVINNPREKGLDCDVVVDELFPFSNDIASSFLPQFATNLFFHSPTRPDAGSDVEVCSEQAVKIGGNDFCQNCEWIPHAYLDNPYSSTPTFTYNNPSDTVQTFLYKKTKLCESDVVQIKVFPKLRPLIYGSYSVCPGVEEVEYWTDLKENHQYAWTVEGGEIVYGQGTNQIKVNWGPTNPNAKVKLVVINEFECTSDEKVFSVKVNVELDTEQPEGLTRVCNNKLTSNTYQISPTNGSIYTWELEGGVIVAGQGTHRATIDWSGVGNHWIRVREKSTTIDTVCYGISEKLPVTVYKDSLALKINSVTLNPTNETEILINGEAKNITGQSSYELNIQKRVVGSFEWTNVSLGTPTEGELLYEDYSSDMDFNVFEYQFQTLNGCDHPISSNVHNTILLEITPDTTKLTWHAYEGWEEGVKHYTIYRKVDNESEFTFITTVLAHSNNYFIENQLDGFNQTFIVQAISNHNDFYSWSNSVSVEFEHELFIPNVFTPNNDGVNDSFFIHPIQLYPENNLTIYNRWGEVVYQTTHYTGNWTADNVSSGVYYYKLYIAKNKRDYRGWLQVVR